MLCRMTAVGMLQTLLVQRDMPDLETIKKALGVAAEGTDNVIMNKMRSMFDLFT